MQTSNKSEVEVDIGKLLTNVEAWVTFVLLKFMPLTHSWFIGIDGQNNNVKIII